MYKYEMVVLPIWLYSLRRLHIVWERTLNYTQVFWQRKDLVEVAVEQECSIVVILVTSRETKINNCIWYQRP